MNLQKIYCMHRPKSAHIPLPAPRPLEGQHAGVVPSFAVQCFDPIIKCSAGDFARDSLLAWVGPLPSPATGKTIRETLVKTRSWGEPFGGMESMGHVQTRVRLVKDWQKVLGTSEFVRMEGFVSRLSSEDEFPSLSTYQVRSGLKTHLSKVIEILAKLEALYWVGDSASPVNFDLQDITPAWRYRVQTVLQQEWVRELDGQDIRFPGYSYPSLEDWANKYLQEPSLPRPAIEQMDALLAADAMTVEQEVLAMAKAALPFIRKGPADDERASLWVEWFVQVNKDGLYRLPADQAERAISSYEESRKAFDTILYELRSRKVAAPRLKNVLEQALKLAPLPMIEVQDNLRSLLGPTFSLVGAMELADAIGLTTSSSNSKIERIFFPGMKRGERIAILKDASAPPWIGAATKYLSDECGAAGCTSYIRVAGHLALVEGVAVSREHLHSVFKALPGFRELDAQDGWISADTSHIKTIQFALRKMLSINTDGISLKELRGGLSAFYEEYTRRAEGRPGVFHVPLHVLEQWLVGMDWLRRDEEGNFHSNIHIAREEFISDEEFGIIQFLSRNGNLATFSELLEFGAKGNIIKTSAVLKRVARGIYGIRGRIVSNGALLEALFRQRGILQTPEERLILAGGVESEQDVSDNNVKLMALKPRLESLPSNANINATLRRRAVLQMNPNTNVVEPVETLASLDIDRPFSFLISPRKKQEGGRALKSPRHIPIPTSFLLHGEYAHQAQEGVVLKIYSYDDRSSASLSVGFIDRLGLPWNSTIRISIDPTKRTFDAVLEEAKSGHDADVAGGDEADEDEEE